MVLAIIRWYLVWKLYWFLYARVSLIRITGDLAAVYVKSKLRPITNACKINITGTVWERRVIYLMRCVIYCLALFAVLTNTIRQYLIYWMARLWLWTQMHNHEFKFDFKFKYDGIARGEEDRGSYYSVDSAYCDETDTTDLIRFFLLLCSSPIEQEKNLGDLCEFVARFGIDKPKTVRVYIQDCNGKSLLHMNIEEKKYLGSTQQPIPEDDADILFGEFEFTANTIVPT